MPGNPPSEQEHRVLLLRNGCLIIELCAAQVLPDGHPGEWGGEAAGQDGGGQGQHRRGGGPHDERVPHPGGLHARLRRHRGHTRA
jgi:hypothetical protein